MVFGNMGDDSGTGVAMSRNATTGENRLEGDYLINAQGEDVVAGIRVTHPIAELAGDLPAAYAEFEDYAKKLETHFRNMQDMEFTVEKGKLWLLQTRDGKRTAQAAVRIAVDMVEEGMITKDEALCVSRPITSTSSSTPSSMSSRRPRRSTATARSPSASTSHPAPRSVSLHSTPISPKPGRRKESP